MSVEYKAKHVGLLLAQPVVVGATYGTLFTEYAETLSRGQDPIPWILTAAVIYWIGAIADTASSLETMDTAYRADMAGIKHNVVEINPLLPDRPTVNDLTRGRGLAIGVAGELLGIAFPPIGISLGAGRVVAAISNTYVARSLEGEIDEIKRLRRARREPVSAEVARDILQTVIATPEISVTSQTPLEQVAGFPMRRIREAIAIAGKDVIDRFPGEEDNHSYTLRKPFGKDPVGATLTFSKLGRINPRSEADLFWDATLEAGDIRVEVPLQISGHINHVSFTDNRRNTSRSVSSSGLGESLSIREHRRLVRGVRWICANIDRWAEGDIILPERLNSLAR